MENHIISQELDKLYSTNLEKYSIEIKEIKRLGYRIYRNPDGKHKAIKQDYQHDIVDQLKSLFGGI